MADCSRAVATTAATRRGPAPHSIGMVCIKLLADSHPAHGALHNLKTPLHDASHYKQYTHTRLLDSSLAGRLSVSCRGGMSCTCTGSVGHVNNTRLSRNCCRHCKQMDAAAAAFQHRQECRGSSTHTAHPVMKKATPASKQPPAATTTCTPCIEYTVSVTG